MSELKKLTGKKTDAIQKKLSIGVADEVWPKKKTQSQTTGVVSSRPTGQATTGASLTKPAKLSSDAWTRATPSQVKVPENTSTETSTTQGSATTQKTSILDRLTGMFKSAGLREASNLTESAGVTMDNTGGTKATDLYQDQLDALDRQIQAAQDQLKRTDLSDVDREDLQWALQQAQDRRKVYANATRANQSTGSALHEVSDQALSAAEQQDQKNTEGLGALGKSVVNLGTGLMQAGMESAANVAAPGLSAVTRGLSAAGAAAGNYRRSTDDYDTGKAQTAGALAGAGVLAGSVLSSAVGSASIGLLKTLGKQNDILPNILASGVAGAGYAAGETGLGEISKAVTYDDYEPNWGEIGTNLATGFAFSAIHSAIDLSKASKANREYAQKLNTELQKRYEQMETIFQQGTPEQKAQGAASVMDGVDQLRTALNRMHLVGAKDEVASINRFLNSIDYEMAYYLPQGASVSNAGALPNSTALTVSVGAQLTPYGNSRSAGLAKESGTSSTVPPVDTVRPNAYTKSETHISAAAAPEARQMEAQAQVSQALRPENQVLDAAATLFVERQGMSASKAKEKAEIVAKLVAGEEVAPREINKLNPTSKTSQEIFTLLTGVQFPDTSLSTEQLYTLYRSAHDLAVQAEVQNVLQSPVQSPTQAPVQTQTQTQTQTQAQTMGQAVAPVQTEPVTPAAQAAEVPAQAVTQQDLPGYGGAEDLPGYGGEAIAVDSAEGQASFPALNRLFGEGQTLTQQMARAGFQANPETQERVAQAQAELNDAVNGTQTAASRKSGNTRSEIKLPDGETLSREDFKAVARETYSQASDSQLDAMFNSLLARTDRGETIPGLEAVAQAAKERKSKSENSPAKAEARSLKEDKNDGGAEKYKLNRTDRRGTFAAGGLEARTVLPDERLRGQIDARTGEPGGSVGQATGRAEGEARPGRDPRPADLDRGGYGTDGGAVRAQENTRGGGEGKARALIEADRRLAQQEAARLRSLKPGAEVSAIPGIGEVRVLSKKYWPNAVRRIERAAARVGGAVQVTLGRIPAPGGGSAEGLTDPNTRRIFLQGDCTSRLISQNGGHELLHLYTSVDDSLRDRLVGRFYDEFQDFDLAGFNTFIQERYKMYAAHYGEYGEAAENFIDEFLADLNGGVRDRAKLPERMFQYLQKIVQAEVRVWEKEWDTAHPAAQQNTDRSSTSQNNAEKPSFSLAVEEDRFFKTPTGVEVIQNPTDAEYRQLREEALRELPWLRGTGEAMLRRTYDEAGNEYYWRADQAIHTQVEPHINRHFDTRTSQQWKWWEKADKDDYPIDYSKYQFSVANDEDSPDFTDQDAPTDLAMKPQKFDSWNAAYLYLENTPGSNLAFAEPPGSSPNIEVGLLDDNGKWVETVGFYGNTPQELARFNKDPPKYLAEAQNASEEELNHLFPPQEGDLADGYSYEYEDGDLDAPPEDFLQNLYAASQQSAEEAVQTNREGFTSTNTKAFKKWFKDPSGEFTNPDGRPKVFLRGSVNMGATTAHDADTAYSEGIFFTTDPSIAAQYAEGATTGHITTLMDAVKGRDNSVIKELKHKYFRGWSPAKEYVQHYFQSQGSGLRLVGLTADGVETNKLSDTDHFSLQTNVATEKQFQEEGWFAEGNWRELAAFPKTKEGLESFNRRLGELVRENHLGLRGYGKYYLTSENPLVVDAAGDDYHGISNDHLPAEVQGEYGDINIDRMVSRAFQNGYDAVIVKNVADVGGEQTQYVVKNSNQVKSVYNRGTWGKDDRDYLFSMAEDDDHRQKLESFFQGLEAEYGEGSAEAMFKTFEQLDRARQRAEERAADAEAAQQAAEWATDAAVEAARIAEQAKADKRLQKQRNTFQEQARQKAAKARLEKANAVKSARLAEQMNAGRQWSKRLREQDERASAKMESMKQAAQERLDQLRASKDQEIEDTRTAERMSAGRQVASTKRKAEAALAEEKAKRVRDHKLASKDAKTAASVLRKYHNTDTSQLTNAPVETLREAYHKPTLNDTAKKAADKLRTAHREFYKAFINGTQAIDDFSKYQKVDANTSVLLRTAMASNSTSQSILKDHLVGKDGSVIDERSLEDVVICWDGTGKHRKYNDDKQRVLQDYMLHRHNIDRMSFRDKALNAVEAYEQTYPWLTTLEPREFAELVADDNRIAQRYQELIEDFQRAKNKPIFQDENGSPLTADYSRSMVRQYEQQFDWVKEKAEDIYDWWDKFMQEWVVGETISPEEYATLRETYPSYVPTYRKDKAGLGNGVSAFGGTVTAKRTIRKATGGTSPVANIEDSFVNLMMKNVKGQRTNMVLRSITDTAMTDADGDFNGFVIFDWDDAPETLRWGLASEGIEGALEAGTDKAAANALSKEGNVCKIRAWANGERVSAYVDPELYKALEFAFNQETGWFTKVGQKLTSPMKTFITGINPGFALRNTIRDNLTAQMNSVSVVNSISGAAFEKYYARAWKEMVSNSENWQHFEALGGTNAGYYNNEGGGYINSLRHQKMQDLNPLNMAGKALGFVGEHTESVTRFAEYLATIDRLPGGDTYGNRLVGIKNAAEVTVDFSRKGTLGKAFNAWIPYWNPAVQGIDKVVRSFFDAPGVAGKAKVLSRAALTTLPLDLILFAVYKYLGRDDEWEELSDRTKDTYYCIPLADEHKFLKIPKSRDWGQIIGVPLMRMLQGLDGREDPFENYFEVSISPNFMWSNPLDAIGLSTAYDLAKNEDFAGRAIVPSSYAEMAKGDQWDADTSMLSKGVADIVNTLSQKFVDEDWLSPMQLDYIISDYFGDFGDMFIRLNSIGGTDKSLPAKEQAGQIAEDLYGNWVADNRYSSASVSDYYDLLDKISQELAAERIQNPDGYQDTPLYKLNSALNEKDNGPSTRIAKLNAQVRNLPDGEEKDAIKGQIVEIAREALEMYDAVQSGEIQEPKLEMQYSKYGEKVSRELIALKDYADDYSFLPSSYKPKSYTDPSNKKKEYVLDEAAQEKYRELYDEEYQSAMEKAMKSSKYKSASAEKRAELLESARDDVAEQAKDEFLKWLKKNYKSTPKK